MKALNSSSWRPALLRLCFILLFACNNSFADGYIEVRAEAGLKIFVNNKLHGETTGKNIYISNLSPGTHVIRAEKDGFDAKELKVNVSDGGVALAEFGAFTPKMNTRQEGKSSAGQATAKTGSLSIKSIPINATIAIPKLNYRESKQKESWIAEGIPIGEYEVTVESSEGDVSFRVFIRDNEQSSYFVNLLTGNVSGVDAASKEAMERAEQKKADELIQAKKRKENEEQLALRRAQEAREKEMAAAAEAQRKRELQFEKLKAVAALPCGNFGGKDGFSVGLDGVSQDGVVKYTVSWYWFDQYSDTEWQTDINYQRQPVSRNATMENRGTSTIEVSTDELIRDGLSFQRTIKIWGGFSWGGGYMTDKRSQTLKYNVSRKTWDVVSGYQQKKIFKQK
ncbi:MAG: hypothetical protein KDC45_10585 [Bacteroidetes bacterium]|nr:hypothetical protein [Bacteroidota bacterium]